MAIQNFNFKDGLLWLPTQFQQNANAPREIIEPLYTKGDLGSLMPFLAIHIPNIFDYTVLPYENILEFEYKVIGASSGVADLKLIDATPIFIETILRRLYNLRSQGFGNDSEEGYKINIEYGWRVQNPTEALKPFLDEDNNIFSSGMIPFTFQTSTYNYSTHGIIINMKMNASIKDYLNEYRIVENLPTRGIIDKISFQNEMNKLIRKSIPDKDLNYRVIVKSDNISFNNLNNSAVALEADKDSVKDAISKIVKKLEIPKQKETADSEVRFYVGHRLVRETNEVGDTEIYYPIFVYDRDDEPEEANHIPLIEFPSNKISPILEFTPTLDGAQSGASFLSNEKYSIIDSEGNRKTITKAIEAVKSGYNAATGENSITAAIYDGQIPDSEKGGIRKSEPALNKVEITMLGDPTFSGFHFFSELDLKMNEIKREGILLDESDFYSNFPQVPTSSSLLSSFSGVDQEEIPDLSNLFSSRGLLPVIEGMDGEISPFNGRYQVRGITHKINNSQGFVTVLNLIFF